ncbi:MAG: hypothetical protein JWM30_4221 [Burkholderia sp.]|nr:hypothetical protein [Burkholderia sp.]
MFDPGNQRFVIFSFMQMKGASTATRNLTIGRIPSTVRASFTPNVNNVTYCEFLFPNTYWGSYMKKLIALIASTLFVGVAFAQAPVATTTAGQGTSVAPATKGDVKTAVKVEKAEIKANEKIDKAVADAAVTSTKADAKAAKTKAGAQAKADKKILTAKKDVAEAQVDANAKVSRDKK